MRRRATGYALILGLLMAPGIVHAQVPTSDQITAEALFNRGLELMDGKQYADACPKFADSQKLAPTLNTLMNLANCYELNGQTASAWEAWKEATAVARDAKKTPYMQTSQQHATALEGKLVRLQLTVSTPAPGMSVKRDGAVVTQSEWGLPVPVDPGKHTIEATAPDYKPWSQSVEVTAAGATTAVVIPALEAAPPPPPPPAPPVSPPVAPAPVQGSWSVQKTLAIVAGAVGVVGLGVGTALVLVAKSKYDDSLNHCPKSRNLCDATGVSLRDDARSSGNVATVGFVVGAAGLLGGVVLWLTAPSAVNAPGGGMARSIELAPTLGGAVLQGSF
jgi:hypothetical protein